MEKKFTIPPVKSLLTDDIHKQVMQEASHFAFNIYVVGGYLRDLVLHTFNPQYELLSKDLDYAIAGASAFDFARHIANKLKGHFVALDQKNDTARVVLPDGHILDFAGCLGDSIEKDILRRDFSINGLYIDTKEPQFIKDKVGGLDDIKNGIIRIISDQVFIDDPLRLLRAFRFSANLNFSIDEKTISLIKNYVDKIKTVAGERISSELFLAFKAVPLKENLLLLAQTGLLEEIFPELIATRQVTNNAYHHLNLFDHSLEAVMRADEEYLTNNVIWQKTNVSSLLHPNLSTLAVCKVAALLHDIGKPATWIITEEGKHTFIGHDRLGADMVSPIAQRLRWSRNVDDIITMLIGLHLRPGQLFHNTPATTKGINRLYRQAGEHFPSLILLALGDLGATKGPQMTDEKTNTLKQKFYELLKGYEEYCLTTEGMTRLLDGHEIMKLLNITPGKTLGQIMQALQEAQEAKEINDRAEAIQFVKAFSQKQINS